MKSEQRIITIGREFGSGGHKVAESLGRLMGIPVLDKNILVSVAKEAGADADLLEKYDKTPRRYFISRTVNGFSNAPEINVAQMQFDYLRKKAEAGESFIIIGRCGDAVLHEHPGRVSVFVLAEQEFKIRRIMDLYKMSRDDAQAEMARRDRTRKNYYNQFCAQFGRYKWGDSRNYDLSVNSARLGIDGTAELIYEYVKRSF